VDVGALKAMGDVNAPHHLPELAGLTREKGVALLDRAAEVGLLSSGGEGYYFIHPALPWYFKNLFEQFYGDSSSGEEAGTGAVRAYVMSMASLSATQSLGTLYKHTGRTAEWKKLMDEITDDFVDPVSGMAVPGREDEWACVMYERAQLAEHARQWREAERLTSLLIDYSRKRAATALATPPDKLDELNRHVIHNLAGSLLRLAKIRRDVGDPQCVAAYEEALELFGLLGDDRGTVVCVFNLGHAYKNIPAIRDLTRAEALYRRSLELRDERDRLRQVLLPARARRARTAGRGARRQRAARELSGSPQRCRRVLSGKPQLTSARRSG
jgi:hypothetical protein